MGDNVQLDRNVPNCPPKTESSDTLNTPKRKKALLTFRSFLAGIVACIATQVISHILINRFDPPQNGQEAQQEKQSAEALWNRFVALNDEIQQWRHSDMQDYGNTINRQTKEHTINAQRQAQMVKPASFAEALELHEANVQGTLILFEDLLAVSKREIPVSRALVDKLNRLELDTHQFHASTDLAIHTKQMIKTESEKLKAEVVSSLAYDFNFLAEFQTYCKNQVAQLKQDPVLNMLPANIRNEDIQRVERYRARWADFQTAWIAADGQALMLSELTFPYVSKK